MKNTKLSDALAWDLYDLLGDEAPALMPLCPYCGFECAMARNIPAPLKVKQWGYYEFGKCSVCRREYVFAYGGWEEVHWSRGT